MNEITSLSPAELRRAADIQERIQSLQAQLGKLLGGAAPMAVAPAKHRMSAAGWARISAAARARWAKARGVGDGAAVARSKPKISAAGRARLSALAKARWQKARASGKGRL